MHSVNANKKILLFSTLIGLGLLLFFIAVMIVDFTRIRPLPPMTVTENNPVVWQLNPVDYGDHFITITGWALIPGEALEKFTAHVVLENTASGELTQIRTMMLPMKQLNDDFPDGIDYTNYGFLAKANQRAIDLSQNSYLIFLHYQHNGHDYFLDLGQTIGALR